MCQNESHETWLFKRLMKDLENVTISGQIHWRSTDQQVKEGNILFQGYEGRIGKTEFEFFHTLEEGHRRFLGKKDKQFVARGLIIVDKGKTTIFTNSKKIEGIEINSLLLRHAFARIQHLIEDKDPATNLLRHLALLLKFTKTHS